MVRLCSSRYDYNTNSVAYACHFIKITLTHQNCTTNRHNPLSHAILVVLQVAWSECNIFYHLRNHTKLHSKSCNYALTSRVFIDSINCTWMGNMKSILTW